MTKRAKESRVTAKMLEVLAALSDGACLQRNRRSSFDLLRGDTRLTAVRRDTWLHLYTRGWIDFDPPTDSYLITVAGHAAYLKARQA